MIFRCMPSPVQARGYLRNYAEFLGLNVDAILEEMREAESHKPSEEVIGPADDENASMPPKNHGTNHDQQGMPVLESPEVSEEKFPPFEQPVPIAEDDLVSQSNSSSSVTIPIKPKPARRKKEKAIPVR